VSKASGISRMMSNGSQIAAVLARLGSRHILHAYLFIAPVIVLFGIFRIVPSIQTLLYSFYKVELLRGRFTFIGLENFTSLLADEVFRKATLNTLTYVVTIVPISAFLGLVLAVLFNARFHLKEFFKAVYFSPMVTSTVAAAMVWWWMYNPQFGIFIEPILEVKNTVLGARNLFQGSLIDAVKSAVEVLAHVIVNLFRIRLPKVCDGFLEAPHIVRKRST
jgi:ABC-type sugar transport system permease subunit